MADSKLITDNLDVQFKAAREGSPLPQQRAEVKAMAKMPKTARVQGGMSRYAQYMMEKKANYQSVSGFAAGTGGANVATSSPEIRNPLLNLINFYLPYDRKTLNQWIRYYDRFQSYIGNCLDIHGEFPISDFHFTGIEDQAVVDLYEEVKEDANLLQYLFEASREYELLGECYAFWKWSNGSDSPSKEGDVPTGYTIINPDLLDVISLSWGAGESMAYAYEPAEELKELVRNQDPAVEKLLSEIDPVVRNALETGEKIPLSDFNVMALIRKASPYDSRGTSIVLRCLKELMYEDKLREAQYAIADQQITPIQLWKLGDPAAGYMPSDEDLEELRQLILSSRHDPLFTIVSHGAINVDLIGYTGKLLPVIPEYEWVAKRVMVALFTNEAMLTGDGPTYSNAIVAMKVLQGRYQSKRDKFQTLFKKKLFEPIAKAHGFYRSIPASANGRVRTSKRQLMVPDMEWNFKLDLTDQTQRMQYLMQLLDKGKIPMKVITEVFNLDYATTKKLMKEEEGTVFDPVYQKNREDKPTAPDTSSIGAPGGAAPDAGGEGADSGDVEVPGATDAAEAPAE